MLDNNETVEVESTSEEVQADAFDLDALINTHFEDEIMAEPDLEHKIGIPTKKFYVTFLRMEGR